MRSVTLLPKKVLTPVVADPLQKERETQLINEHKSLDKGLVAGLVKKSNRILISISSHRFPIDLFPDTVNVEEGRVTVITREFFFSSQIHSVDIKDISNIFINFGPFFAQLVLVSKTFAENEIRVRALWKNEAVMLRRIVEGLRVFESKQIDTSVYSKAELITKLEELSKTAIVT